MRDHINEEGKFQSDKYLWCRAGFVPLKLTDPMAHQVLWDYAEKRESVDKEFSEDLRTCLVAEGFVPVWKKAGVIAGEPEYDIRNSAQVKIANQDLKDTVFRLMEVLADRNAQISRLRVEAFYNGFMELSADEFSTKQKAVIRTVFDEITAKHTQGKTEWKLSAACVSLVRAPF